METTIIKKYENCLGESFLLYIYNKIIDENKGNITNQTENYAKDESMIKTISIQLYAPYSNGSDPSFELNLKSMHEHWVKILNAINPSLEEELSPEIERVFIYTDDETLLVQLNDETVSVLYTYSGQW